MSLLIPSSKFKFLINTVILLLSTTLQAQKNKYDLFLYNKPAGWTSKSVNGVLQLIATNKKTGAYAMICFYPSHPGKGNIDDDFVTAWKELLVTPLQVRDSANGQAGDQIGNWKSKGGVTSFPFEGRESVAMLMTFSNGALAANLVMVTNSQEYDTQINTFTKTVKITDPVVQKSLPEKNNDYGKVTTPIVTANGNGKFTFTTTNFDDGWVSTEQPDWVEAHKGNITVLIHYPRPADKEYVSQQDEDTRLHWNALVAPRYSNLRNFDLYGYNMSSEPAHFAAGDLTENSTGKTVYVALFQKYRSNWIEIITPDRETFVQTFKVDHPNSYFSDWEPLINLNGLNKFAVASSDLNGKWTNNFSGTTMYANVYTGITTSINTYSSLETFTFRGNQCEWFLSAGTTVNGVTNGQSGKTSGAFSMQGNWQIRFSNIDHKARLYNAFFTCVKGGRVLWLQDTGYGGFTPYAKAE